MKKNETKLFFERTISVFAWLSFFLAIVMAAITFFASLSGKDNGKEIFGRRMLIVEGDSMSKSEISENEEIFFSVGDLIVIETVKDTGSLKAGDVITFISQSPESMGKTVTHKIREIQYSEDGEISGFVTYGINKGKNDTVPASPDYIIGKYNFKVEGIGNLFLFLKTPRGFYLSILIPAVLLIIFFSITVGKILGKLELEKNYTDEIDSLKARVKALEEKYEESEKANPKSEILPVVLEDDKKIEKNTLVIPQGKKTAFSEKLLNLDKNGKAYFNTLHNELISYIKVHSRVSFRCVSYRFGKKLLAKMTIRGKTLKLHLNLNTDSFNENVYFQKNLSLLKFYEDVPFTVKVKSPRAEKNAIKLISALALRHELVKNEKFTPEDIINKISGSIEEIPQEFTHELNSEETEKAGFYLRTLPKGKKISFSAKLSELKEETKNYFEAINSELTSLKKVHARFSFRCISYRIGKKLLAKMTVRGKTLRLHLNLNINDFNEKVYFQRDLSEFKFYSEVPFTVKIKSNRSLKNALKLIEAIGQKFELVKNKNEKMNII